MDDIDGSGAHSTHRWRCCSNSSSRMDSRKPLADEIIVIDDGNAILDASSSERIKRMNRDAAALSDTAHQLRFSEETLMSGGRPVVPGLI